MTAILSTHALGRTFRTKGGPLHALTEVTIDCLPGRSLGVVGESGCGKTTLNRLILMLDSHGKIAPSMPSERMFFTAIDGSGKKVIDKQVRKGPQGVVSPSPCLIRVYVRRMENLMAKR